MGLTYAQVRVTGSKASEELQLLVDTGSLYTWIHGRVLDNLGASGLGERRFRTIEGRDITRRVGEAVIESSGERATRIVVFAEEGDAQVMGADSLEGLGLELDPTTRRLKKVEAFIAY